VIILRYGVPWARSRFGYHWSQALLDRLTPARRSILEPIPPIHAGDTRIPLDLDQRAAVQPA
jgi:hypothetical protein